MNEASTIIQSAAHEDANIIFGAVLDEKMKDEVKITVIATGFKEATRNRDHAGAASAVLNARAAASATFRCRRCASPNPRNRLPHPTLPQPNRASPNGRETCPTFPIPIDDLDLESEVVRHAEPVEEARAAAATYSREAENTYATYAVDRVGGETLRRAARYRHRQQQREHQLRCQRSGDSAFLRKRGEG